MADIVNGLNWKTSQILILALRQKFRKFNLVWLRYYAWILQLTMTMENLRTHYLVFILIKIRKLKVFVHFSKSFGPSGDIHYDYVKSASHWLTFETTSSEATYLVWRHWRYCWWNHRRRLVWRNRRYQLEIFTSFFTFKDNFFYKSFRFYTL